MPPCQNFLLVPLLVVSALAANNTTDSTIQWGPCKEIPKSNLSVPISCATLEVPLDYLANNGSTLTLNLAKISATKGPRGKTVMYNPGGPGDGGRNVLFLDWTQIFSNVGPTHDVVSWDPRGTGQTLPVNCFPNSEAQLAYQLSTPYAANASNVALQQAWAASTTYALSCAEYAKNWGELVGTAYTVRDMMQIVDALGEDGMLRYYGQSYGTALGATAAAMFPDRVASMVLDGVLNPSQYYDGRSVQQFTSTDAVFDGFLQQCVAVPELCPAARFNTPTVGLTQQVYDTLELLKTDPIVNGPDATNLMGYGQAKNAIDTYIHGIGNLWHGLSSTVEFLLSRNATLYNNIPTPWVGPFGDNPTDAADTIRCGDTTLRANTLEEIMPLINEFYEISSVLGDFAAVLYPITCVQWPFKAKEIYSGGWTNIHTKNPILFIGNTFDPITSLEGAKNASAVFPGSRVLVQNGYGHSSWGQYSTCTMNAIKTYFLNGTMPAEFAQCQVDDGILAETPYYRLNY